MTNDLISSRGSTLLRLAATCKANNVAILSDLVLFAACAPSAMHASCVVLITFGDSGGIQYGECVHDI